MTVATIPMLMIYPEVILVPPYHSTALVLCQRAQHLCYKATPKVETIYRIEMMIDQYISLLKGLNIRVSNCRYNNVL